jgi:hypothetical protein
VIRAAVAAVVAAAVTLPALAGPAAAAGTAYSAQWSGLVATAGGYTAVSAEFTVPKVTGRCGLDSAAAVFIGLGGWGRVPFAQNGITLTPGGRVGVWSEVFDARGRGPITSRQLPVKAGDRLRLGLGFSPSHQTLVFTWVNLTSRRQTSQTVHGAAGYFNGATADLVVERPWFPYRGAPLADYGRVSFAGARVLRPGGWRPAAVERSVSVTTLGGRGNAVARTTAGGLTAVWAGCR